MIGAAQCSETANLSAARAAAALRRRRVLAVFVSLLLSACATYQPAPIDAGRSAEKFAARRLDSAEMHDRVGELLPQTASAWPPASWDRAQLLVAALVLNPKIEVARAQVGSALAHEITVAQPANPQTTLQSEYARHDPHPWLYGLSFDLLLRAPERKRLEADLALLETSGARRQLMDEAWTTRRALIAALSERETVVRRLALLTPLLAAEERRIELERRRIAAGEDGAEQLLTATQARIDAERQQAQARVDRVQADAMLAAAIGIVPAALDGVDISWPDWGAPPAVAAAAQGAARDQALRTRADLAAAIDAYAAAENRLHQAILHQYPQFHLSPGYYWDHGVAKLPLNVSFDLPLFNRGEIAEARAAREIAGQRMLALQADIIGAIDAAQRGEAVSLQNLTVAERGLQAARDERRHSATRLRLSAIDAGEDIAAEIALLRAQLDVVQQSAQVQAARDALEDALHAPLSGPELGLAKSLPAAVAGADR